MRACGSCGLCCKLIGIKELNKPMRQSCPNWEKGTGCKIYENRPKECRDFACLWLSDMLPGRLKPLKTGIVAHLNSIYGLMLEEDDHADAQIAFRDAIGEWTGRGLDVTIVRA